ncbi:DUF4408 domain-containing protein [Cephalotus follicularis]|uniref:DUF4408 domain-containing protein n=1 Tax=Cephalotus follicularis TaxID=3775 RepID=A0A1Q3D1K6_CEPFO|nr:DUF4408 domain-containing protein [Cephalotus follicularis]
MATEIKAMGIYKRNHQFLYNLILHSLTALSCSLLCSYPYWLPSICSSMKHYMFISLPYMWSSFFNPMCLFIVVNAIVVFLVGESKLGGSHSSPADEVYEEYVERSARHYAVSSFPQKKEEKKLEMNLVDESEKYIVEHKKVKKDQHAKQQVEGNVVEVGEEVDKEKERDGEEEHGYVTDEELNKRIEDFIARVNKQRLLEAK